MEPDQTLGTQTPDQNPNCKVIALIAKYASTNPIIHFGARSDAGYPAA